MSSMENPLVHLINTPDEADVCLTGKENVNPSSLLLGANWSGSSTFSTNSFSDEAIKSNRSCKQEPRIGKKKHIKWHLKSTVHVYCCHLACASHQILGNWLPLHIIFQAKRSLATEMNSQNPKISTPKIQSIKCSFLAPEEGKVTEKENHPVRTAKNAPTLQHKHDKHV